MKRILITFLVLGVISPVFADSSFMPMMIGTSLMVNAASRNAQQEANISQITNEFYSCKQNKGGNACYINRCIKYGGGIVSCTNKYMKK